MYSVNNQNHEEIIKQLTNQELKILKLASNQLSNKEIASELFIAEATVKKHRENICRKLRINGRVAMRTFLRFINAFLK